MIFEFLWFNRSSFLHKIVYPVYRGGSRAPFEGGRVSKNFEIDEFFFLVQTKISQNFLMFLMLQINDLFSFFALRSRNSEENLIISHFFPFGGEYFSTPDPSLPVYTFAIQKISLDNANFNLVIFKRMQRNKIFIEKNIHPQLHIINVWHT